MSSVKSSGPATATNVGSQGSTSSENLLGAGAGGAGIGLGVGNAGVGGLGANAQLAEQFTGQALDQAAAAVSANEATDNLEANKTFNFGGNTIV